MKPIRQLTIQVPREVGDALSTLSDVTGEPPDAHVHRAVIQYLDGTGRRTLVTGLTDRARDQLRGALEELTGPSR